MFNKMDKSWIVNPMNRATWAWYGKNFFLPILGITQKKTAPFWEQSHFSWALGCQLNLPSYVHSFATTESQC